MGLNGMRVVILGGTSGIGPATAKAAQREGAAVVVASSRRQPTISPPGYLYLMQQGYGTGQVIIVDGGAVLADFTPEAFDTLS